MFFEVNRQDFRTTRTVEPAGSELEPGQIRLAIERFAVTTNNITYAVAGDLLDYWGFFPADAPWGRVPVMGLGSVIESANPDIATGGRYFGFYPMGSEHVLTAQARASGFRDVGPNRADHATTYTDFRDVEADPMFQPDRADEFLLLWGMFMTSFLVDDYLADGNFGGAAQTLITSASSKTSISLATCLAERSGHRSVGLTSERNRTFVEGLGLYDQTITYDEIDQLDASVASALVDMAGSGPVRAAVHIHFGDRLVTSLTVGVTHWEDQAHGDADPLPGPAPEFFFAPAQSAKRTKEWGADELNRRIGAAFGALLDGTDRWLTVERRTGPDGIEATYRDLLEGRADPSAGFICSMDDPDLT